MSKSKVILGVGVGLGILGAVAGTLAAVSKVKKSKEVEEGLCPSDELFGCEDCVDCIDGDCLFNEFGKDSPYNGFDECDYESFVEETEEVKPKKRSKSKEDGNETF